MERGCLDGASFLGIKYVCMCYGSTDGITPTLSTNLPSYWYFYPYPLRYSDLMVSRATQLNALDSPQVVFS